VSDPEHGSLWKYLTAATLTAVASWAPSAMGADYWIAPGQDIVLAAQVRFHDGTGEVEVGLFGISWPWPRIGVPP
jgi:hypothetical protein